MGNVNIKKTTADIETARHSMSHILAAAVVEMFPEAKLGIGPAVENGFYYDFDLPRTLIPEDLPLIEEKMRGIIKKDLKFEEQEVFVEEALKKLEKSDEVYKCELVEELKGQGEKKVKLYKTGSFIDLCKGPHVVSTTQLKGIAFKLDKIAGAYWRGDEKNKMLQRIYALAFETKKELDDYFQNREEAGKRDHKKIGQDLDLFSFHPECPGMPLWHEKGMIIWNQLEAFGKSIRKKYGSIEIKTPILAKDVLWKTSGHWDHYKDSMFIFEVDKEGYAIKPMDCPFNILIYKTKQRSYRDLPIRYTEIGRVYRNEKSGELNGLLRVQEVTQDDSHVLLREDQVEQEIGNLLEMTKEFYSKLGLEPQFFLSTRPDDFMGEIKTWDKAEADLKKVLETKKIKYGLKEKDGAFYGPKIDVNAEDALGRSWQVATIQLDFQLPGRFNCEYIDKGGKAKTPVMIHAAIFGAFERMIGILLEHYAGALPLWLASVQAIVLPIADRHNEYAEKVTQELKDNGVRAQVDVKSETIGRKIREAELQKIPYILVVGDKEVESKKVAVRKSGVDEGQKEQGNIVKEIQNS
jgi:threonyl-tRNA synthetase